MTTLVTVGRGAISERNELHGTGWYDCTQASAMRACADAGIVFPLADLDLEREALERADDYPDETGATMAAIVTAMSRRYRYSGAAVSDLHAALRTPGYTLLVQGAYPQFPTAQRRWSPKFQGGHAVAYRVNTPTSGTLLDPMAPMGFAGDTVTPAVMEAFAWGASTTRAMKWAKPPETSTGEDMAGLKFNIVSEERGTLTVQQDGSWAVLVDGSGHVSFNKGTKKRYVARIRLAANYGAAPNTQDGFLVGTTAAIFFARNVTAISDAPPASARDAANAALDKVASFALAQKG